MIESRKIGIACDHAGYKTKELLKAYLEEQGYKVTDYGTNSTESCDYPDYAHAMATSLVNGTNQLGISICGSGNGINMTVNKYPQIRAALCWTPVIAELAVQHNNANVCSLPARYVSDEIAKEIIDAFLNSEFEGGRHQKRIDKIPIQ